MNFSDLPSIFRFFQQNLEKIWKTFFWRSKIWNFVDFWKIIAQLWLQISLPSKMSQRHYRGLRSTTSNELFRTTLDFNIFPAKFRENGKNSFSVKICKIVDKKCHFGPTSWLSKFDTILSLNIFLKHIFEIYIQNVVQGTPKTSH